jgi:drug/metabolite transporter (DMT)-like permease
MGALSLGEKVRKLRWALVLGAFAGTMVIVRPGSQHFDWVLIFPLVLILTNSGFQLLTSRMARTEDPVTMNVLTGWVGTALGAFLLPFVWELPTEWFVWAQLLLMGSFATVGHYLLILAFSKAPATVLTPYFYTQIVFAMLGGWLIFDHMPDHWTLLAKLAAKSDCSDDVPNRPVDVPGYIGSAANIAAELGLIAASTWS